MKNGITEIVFIIDQSGSMAGFESDTIGGFNAAMQRQKTLPGKAYVTTVLFDNGGHLLHDRILLEQLQPMTESDYQPGGCTALFDAIGETVEHIAKIHRYARPEDIPENTIFMITTDGMENASRKYCRSKIQELIEHYRDQHGWEFLFLASNIDAVETARSIGIKEDRAADFDQSEDGYEDCYMCFCDAITEMRSGGSLDDDLWRQSIDIKDTEEDTSND